MAWMFAAVGDVHGHMKAMVERLRHFERDLDLQLDAVFQVGDFEPHRHQHDLSGMAAPAKYRALGDFPEFHQGREVFPWPVYFIGGNHEPYGFLDDLHSPAEIADNCFYLGRSHCFDWCGLKVAGLSGIFVEDQYSQKRPPAADIDYRSNKDYIGFKDHEVQHILDQDRVDLLLLHEWPLGVIHERDLAALKDVTRKQRYDAPGNEDAMLLIEYLQPRLVLAGHMHVRYERRLAWEQGTQTQFTALSHVQGGHDGFAIFSWDGQVIEPVL